MSALIPQNISVPAHLARFVGKPSTLGQSIAAGIGGGPAFPRISIKGSRFRIVEDGAETVLPTVVLDVVIVGANPRLSKTYYASKWDPNGEPVAPDCYSMNGLSPHPEAERPQHDLCATCPHNVWGSAVGPQGQKLKACTDKKRLAVVSADDPAGPAYLLEVTPAALKGLNSYHKELSVRGIPAEIVKTRIGFDTDASFPKLTFSFGGFLTDEEVTAVEDRFGSPEVLDITGESQAEAPAPAPVQAAPKARTAAAPVQAAPEPVQEPAEPAAPKRGFGAAKAAAPVQAAPAAAPAAAKATKATKATKSEPPAAAQTDDISSLADEIAALMEEDDDG